MKILPPVSIEARRLLPSRWDLLAAVLVLGFIVAFADVSRFLVHPLSSISGDYLKLNPADLPGYALRTGLRMLIALGVSLAFTFTYATWAAKNPRAGTLLVPLLDILQSMPILSFLSVTIVWFLSLSPGRIFGRGTGLRLHHLHRPGLEHGLQLLPVAAHRAAGTGGGRPHVRPAAWARFWRIEAPFATPPLIWNMMMSMSGGWFFVTAFRSHQRGQDQYRPARHRLLDRGRHRPEEPARHLRGHRRHAGGDPDL